MSTLEAKLELLSTIPEEYQKEIQQFLLMNFCSENPYKPFGKNEILSKLAQLRECYERGKVNSCRCERNKKATVGYC